MRGRFVPERAWRRGSGDIASCTCGTASASPGTARSPPCWLGRGGSPRPAFPARTGPSLPRNCGGLYSKKNNLSGRYFTYINIHLYGYVQRQQEPGGQRDDRPGMLPPKHWPKPGSLGDAAGIPAVPAPERLRLPLPCNARQVSATTEGSVPKQSPERGAPCPGAATRGPAHPPLSSGKAGSLPAPGPAPRETGGSLGITLPCPPLSPHTGVGEEARSQWQRVVGEDGVIGGAGAGGVLAGGRVLLEGHGEVQVLPGETATSALAPSAPTLPARPPPRSPPPKQLPGSCPAPPPAA